MLSLPLWWTADSICACPKGADCPSPGKHPIPSATPNGLKDASADPAQIEAWRKQYPLAHWATVTGAPSGIVVIDLDRKPGKSGLASLKALGTVPRTATVRTGSGGLHLYFRHPGGSIPNSAGKLGPGIDVRGENGYVVAPPSGHVSGGTYEWALDIPPADLPDWLLAKLQIHDSRPAADPDPLTVEDWPPASPEVLEAARTALEKHGPAIQGNGGDDHTFRAGALLTHDFALTDAEAWPLFLEWNSECQPSWSERELRSKLRSGAKYGSNEYGCKRPFHALERALQELKRWDGDRLTMSTMVDRLSIYSARCTSLVDRALIKKELMALTGLKVKEFVLAQPPGPAPKQGEIQVTPELHKVADASILAIAPKVYQRAGVLCEVVTGDRTYLHDLEGPRVQDLMSECATFVVADDKGLKTTTAPERVATILVARRIHPVRVIEAVTTAPIFLADGSILSEQGYNAEARVYLNPSVAVTVPEEPTLLDAKASVAVLFDLVCDYQFAEPADRSSWVAGLLSPLVKAATNNAPVPLICVSASNAGAGKTLLTDVIARIVTGQGAEIRPYNIRDTNEWTKRLTSFVKAGSPVSVFDNVNGAIGDESLDRLITSSTWSDRLLGASEAPPLPNVTTWFATGNNIEPHDDTVRRVLMVRVVVDTERPQERTGFKRPLLADYVQEHRAELLGHALTILRAYHLAGRPAQNLPPWGSFTSWSALVRGALVWAGCADPFLTQQRLSRDTMEPENEAHDFWLTVVDESDGSPGGIASVANSKDAQTVLGARDTINPHNLRKFLNRFVDKPRQKRRIRRAGQRYTVEDVW